MKYFNQTNVNSLTVVLQCGLVYADGNHLQINFFYFLFIQIFEINILKK